MSKRRVIDRSTIMSLLYNTSIREQIPELKTLFDNVRRGTACCGKKSVDKIPASGIRRVKIALMGLSEDKKNLLKEVLKADILVFHHPK